MIDSYKMYSRFACKNHLAMSNEDLVRMYKATNLENEQSQIISALFVKNFPLMLRVTNKWDYVDSAEKASMVTMELLETIADYNFSNMFTTYFIARLENKFLWTYTGKKEVLHMEWDSVSLNETVNDDPEGDFKIQIEDKFYEQEKKTREFYAEIDTMFEKEFSKCVDEAYRDKLVMAKKMIEVLKQDESLVNDQVARMLGLFVDKATKAQKEAGEHKYIYDYSPKYPDYKRIKVMDQDGNFIRYEMKEEPVVKRAQWGKIAELRKFLAGLFIQHGICPAVTR